MDESIFKAYDIRGVYPDQLNEELAYKITQAYTKIFNPKKVVLGRDVRISGPALWEAAARGFTDAGVDVIDIGEVSTDMMYFAAATLPVDGGVTITASHNPREYNGMKMVKENAIPIAGESGVYEIRDVVKEGYEIQVEDKGVITKEAIMDAYIAHCLSFIEPSKIVPMKIVADANFGLAGQVLDRLIAAADLPLEVVPLNYEPDGSFPKGRPDPLIPENRTETGKAVKTSGSSFAVAWDADADRCFFFDEHGDFIDGYFVLALLATIMLRQEPHQNVIIDARMVLATRKAIQDAGGTPIVNKIGHSYIKERMRQENVLFAGENSAHYYFKNNYFCDNGMIPFLLILQELSTSGKSLRELVSTWTDEVVVTGEVNYRVKDTGEVITDMKEEFIDGKQDETDGLSVEYTDARFNVRASNTEPLLRLNTEAYSKERRDELFEKVDSFIKQYTVDS